MKTASSLFYFAFVIYLIVLNSCIRKIAVADKVSTVLNDKPISFFISVISDSRDGQAPGIIIRQNIVPDSTIRQVFLGSEIDVTSEEFAYLEKLYREELNNLSQAPESTKKRAYSSFSVYFHVPPISDSIVEIQNKYLTNIFLKNLLLKIDTRSSKLSDVTKKNTSAVLRKNIERIGNW